MPVGGAGKSVREIMQAAQADVVSAVKEFAEQVAAKKHQHAEEIRQNGKLVLKKMDDDHQDTNNAFAEMLGNEHAGMTEGNSEQS